MKLQEVDLNRYIEVNDIHIMQKELCALFYEFHKICEDNNLIYNMYGGTLLGAIRHQGIIPWDDDVDVSMPRDDYEKFIKIVNEKYKDDFIAYAFPQENYVYPYAKFGSRKSLLIEPLRNKYNKSSLYVDIFPIDGCSENKKTRDKEFSILKRLKHSRGVCVDLIPPLPTLSGKVMNFLRHCRAILFRMVGYKRFLKKEVNISKQYDFYKSTYVCCMASSWFEQGIVTREEYLDRRLYKFEQYEFWGMRNYDRHLTNLYGDYMQPPSIDKRISHHNYHLFLEKNKLSEENNG